jgi:C-terminal processing protease CtpA/Prc
MLAVAIKDFQLGTLIGEETGGRANFYGSSYQFDLPATGIPTRVSYAQFIRPSGELDDKGALPDHEVNSRVEDKIAGIDTVMEYAITLIESSVN